MKRLPKIIEDFYKEKTEEKLQEFREFYFRLKTIGSISHHDSQWKDIFIHYDFEWEDWWDEYCEGLHNLVGCFHEDEMKKTRRRFFSSIFSEEGEALFILWLYGGEKKHLKPFYDWFREFMERKKKERKEEMRKERLRELKELKRKKEKPGYIYVIKAGRYYKVGKARRLGDRVETHQTSNPLEVKLIVEKWVKDYDSAEEELHKMFDHKRVKREWFKFNRDDIKAIKDFLKTREIKK